ncbi:MAG: class I SAM-dependent methyltransferase [Flavobacterium sp.]|uniref:class I SAM-dependent methyltransferase n=1 Tax=Flavobacterium sp. TaxID=239 RepID=UPI0022C073FB|nr:class I SAM-dependent methyltransferase [Flavobacterium sp.]MCZ8197455.1 class I SAM-dependent methyltransferase [Flavobacterium sp.]
MILRKIQNRINKERVNPSFLSFFINDYYLIKSEIYNQIKINSKYLNGSTMDFGCGTKPYKEFFVKNKEYIGVDLQIEGWEERQKYADCFYDGRTLPFNEERFDSMLCTEVLEHVFNIEELLSEFNRVLKKGGIALITTPFMWEEHEMPYDFARYTTPALNFLYKKHGFEIVSHFKCGNNAKVISQFRLNFIKSYLPKNRTIKQILMIPFIIYFNTRATLISLLFPGDGTMYFNNVYLLKKA